MLILPQAQESVAYQVRPEGTGRGWTDPSSLSEPEPYETGFVESYGNGSLSSRGRTQINEGGQARTPGIHGTFRPGVKSDPESEALSFLPGLSRTNQVLRFELEGVFPRQVCPEMVGPRADGAYYCVDEYHGFCDRRSGTCVCYEGYDGIDCASCKTTHFLSEDGTKCLLKHLCPNDCSGAGTCNLSTGTCACKSHRVGADCSIPRCHNSAGGELCHSCDAISGECTQCVDLYYLASNGTCQPCASMDPRCVLCTAEDGCLACGDPLLLSIRRSGRRVTDPELPDDEKQRELSISLPFGSQSPLAFDEAETFSIVQSAESTPLKNMSVACKQGPSTAEWTCDTFLESHTVCGHFGTLSFSSPAYAVSESAQYVEITVKRSGGGYGHIAVDYELQYGTAGPEDVSATASYTTSQRLDFLPGVVSLTFNVAIHDDMLLEEDEYFDLILLNPRTVDLQDGARVDSANLGPQHQARVVIHDDDYWYANPEASYLSHSNWTFYVDETCNISVFLRTATNLSLTEALPDPMKLFIQITDEAPARQDVELIECAHLFNDQYSCEHLIDDAKENIVIVSLAKPGGLIAEYFDLPFIENEEPALRRVDAVLDFVWGHGPIFNTVRDYVTVRWFGGLRLPAEASSTVVQIQVFANDQVRLTLDGRVILDRWDHQSVGDAGSVMVTLTRARLHQLQVDYRELADSAHLRLMWSIDEKELEVIPPGALFQILPLQEVKASIVTGDVNAPATFATGTCLHHATAGIPCTFQIHPRDKYHNADPNIPQEQFFEAIATLENASMSGNSIQSGLSVIVGSVTNTGSSPSTVLMTLDPQAAGTYSLNVTIGGREVFGSPFVLEVAPGHPDGPTFDAFGDGIESALTHVVGETKLINITLRDAYGNLIDRDYTSLILVQAIHQLPPGERYLANLTYLGNSQYQALYIVTRAGTLKVQLTIACQQFIAEVPCEHIVDSPYTLVFMHAAANAYETYISGAGSLAATSGVEANFLVHLRDEFGNSVVDPAPEAASSLSIKLVFEDLSEEDFNDTCTHISLDVFRCTYTPAKAQNQALLYVKLQNTFIHGGTPYTIDIGDGSCNGTQSVAIGEGTYYAVAGDLTTIQIQSHDAAGNLRVGPCSNGSNFLVEGDYFVSSLAPQENEPGTYTLTYNATVAGNFPITVYLADAAGVFIENVMGSPFNITVGPSAIEHAHAELRGEGLDYGVAGELHPVTIQAVDYFGNNLSDAGSAEVKFMVSYVEEDLVYEPDYLGNGFYNASFIPNIAQEGTLRISVTQPGGIDASYYQTHSLSKLIDEKVESTLDYSWGAEAGWAARFIGLIRVPSEGAPWTSEDYDLRLNLLNQNQVRLAFRLRIYGGGARLWVGNKLLINEWPKASRAETQWVNLTSIPQPLEFLPLQMDYARMIGDPSGSLALEWVILDRTGQFATEPEVVPPSSLYRWRQIQTFNPLTVPAAAHPPSSYVVDWSPLESLIANVETTFQVQVTDQFGNNVLNHTDNIEVYGWFVPDLRGVDEGLDPEGVLIAGSVLAASQGGLFNVSLTPTLSGEFLVFIAVNTPEIHADWGRSKLLELLRNYQVADAPRRLLVSAGAISADLSEVFGPQLNAIVAGEPGIFYVQVRDVDGNYRASALDINTVHTNSSANWQGEFEYLGDGLFKFSFNVTSAGMWPVAIELADESRMPEFNLTVYPAQSHAAASTTRVLGNSEPHSSPLQVEVISRDQFGNLRSEGGDRFVLNLRIQDAFTAQLALGEEPSEDFTTYRFGAPWTDFLLDTVDHDNGTYTLTIDLGSLEGSFLLDVELANGHGLTTKYFSSATAELNQESILSQIEQNHSPEDAGVAQEALHAMRAHWSGYVWAEHTDNYTFDLLAENENTESREVSFLSVANVGIESTTQSLYLRGNRLYPIEVESTLFQRKSLTLQWSTALGADSPKETPDVELPGSVKVTKYSQTFITNINLANQLQEGDKIRVGNETFYIQEFDQTQKTLYVDHPYGGESGNQEKIYRRPRTHSIPNDNLYYGASPIGGSPLTLIVQNA